MKKIFYLSIITMASLISNEESSTSGENEPSLPDVNQRIYLTLENLSAVRQAQKDNLPQGGLSRSNTAMEEAFLDLFRKQSADSRREKIRSCYEEQRNLITELGLNLPIPNISGSDVYSSEKENNIMLICFRTKNIMDQLEEQLHQLWYITESIHKDSQEKKEETRYREE